MKTSWFLVLGISNTVGTLAAIIGTVGAGFFVELVGSFLGFLLQWSLWKQCLQRLFWWCQRIKSQTGFKNQDQDSRFKIQVNNQEKTQSR